MAKSLSEIFEEHLAEGCTDKQCDPQRPDLLAKHLADLADKHYQPLRDDHSLLQRTYARLGAGHDRLRREARRI